MPQHGADTVIPRNVRLVLMDCFETLVEMQNGAYQPRRGILEFLRHFTSEGKVPVAVISDAGEAPIAEALKQAGLAHLIARIYHSRNAAQLLPDGRSRKRLDVPLKDFQCAGREAVFIGDSPLDSLAANQFGVPFIRVPRSEDAGFSFATLISGPSRYRSGDFAVLMLDRYKQDA